MRMTDEKTRTAQIAGEALTKIIAGQDITKDEERAIEERKIDHEEWKGVVETEQ